MRRENLIKVILIIFAVLYLLGRWVFISPITNRPCLSARIYSEIKRPKEYDAYLSGFEKCAYKKLFTYCRIDIYLVDNGKKAIIFHSYEKMGSAAGLLARIEYKEIVNVNSIKKLEKLLNNPNIVDLNLSGGGAGQHPIIQGKDLHYLIYDYHLSDSEQELLEKLEEIKAPGGVISYVMDSLDNNVEGQRQMIDYIDSLEDVEDGDLADEVLRIKKQSLIDEGE